MLKLRIKGVRSLFFNLRSFHVESLLPRRGSGTAGRILSSPLEIPAEHKADTSGVPFLTGSRISQAQNERRSRTNFVF